MLQLTYLSLLFLPVQDEAVAQGPVAPELSPAALTSVEASPADLRATFNFQGGGVDIGALIRSSYAHVEDNLVGDDNVSGWVFQDVDVWLEGEIGDFDWRVSMDFNDDQFGTVEEDQSIGGLFGEDEETADQAFRALLDHLLLGEGGNAALEDAYADFNPCENFLIRWGQFKAPTFLTNQVDPEQQLFIGRSIIGSVFDSWDHGVMVQHEQERFSVSGAIQNSIDGASEGNRLTLRGEFYPSGEHVSGTGGQEGSREASDELTTTIGAVYVRDNAIEEVIDQDAHLLGFDAAATMGPLSGQAELAFLSDGLGDAKPFGVSVGYLLNPKYEVSLRYGKLDNEIDTRVLDAALNYYMDSAKVSLQISNFRSDGDADGTALLLGLTLGGSRPSSN